MLASMQLTEMYCQFAARFTVTTAFLPTKLDDAFLEAYRNISE